MPQDENFRARFRREPNWQRYSFWESPIQATFHRACQIRE